MNLQTLTTSDIETLKQKEINDEDYLKIITAMVTNNDPEALLHFYLQSQKNKTRIILLKKLVDSGCYVLLPELIDHYIDDNNLEMVEKYIDLAILRGDYSHMKKLINFYVKNDKMEKVEKYISDELSKDNHKILPEILHTLLKCNKHEQVKKYAQIAIEKYKYDCRNIAESYYSVNVNMCYHLYLLLYKNLGKYMDEIVYLYNMSRIIPGDEIYDFLLMPKIENLRAREIEIIINCILKKDKSSLEKRTLLQKIYQHFVSHEISHTQIIIDALNKINIEIGAMNNEEINKKDKVIENLNDRMNSMMELLNKLAISNGIVDEKRKRRA